jgi:hypothetical protein
MAGSGELVGGPARPPPGTIVASTLVDRKGRTLELENHQIRGRGVDRPDVALRPAGSVAIALGLGEQLLLDLVTI